MSLIKTPVEACQKVELLQNFYGEDILTQPLYNFYKFNQDWFSHMRDHGNQELDLPPLAIPFS